MPSAPSNYINELLMGLLSQKRLPMEPSPGLSQHLTQYRQGRTNPRGTIDTTNVTAIPPPISKDPWFDEVSASTSDPSGHKTLVRDMMSAAGVEPRGAYARYYSQLLEINDAFVARIARQLGLQTDNLSPNEIRSLIAAEFHHYS